MEPLQHALPATVVNLLRRSPMSQGKIEFAWRMVVGPAIDRVTRVALVDQTVLEVSATAPAWRREVVRSRKEILSRLRELLGPQAITALRVAPGQGEGRR